LPIDNKEYYTSRVTAIAEFHNSGQPVCTVGDGLNDAPVLKAAQVESAM